MVLLQRSWPCSRYRPQPTALPRVREGPWPNASALNGRRVRSWRFRPDAVHTCSSLGASGGRTVRRCVCAPELQLHARARAVTTLRRVASQQPMAPAPPPTVGRTSMHRCTQRTARTDASPAPQVGRAHQCPGSFIAAAPTAAAGHRRIPRMGSGGVRWERACCPLRSRRAVLPAICCCGASSGGRAWRHMPANCIPRRPAHSNVCSQCALGRSAMARCPRNAFPSAWRWRYVDVMRSQVSDDGNILPRCIPKKGSDEKRAPSWQYIAAVYSK